MTFLTNSLYFVASINKPETVHYNVYLWQTVMSRHKLEISQIRKLFKIILIDDESEMKLLILSRYHEEWRQDRKLIMVIELSGVQFGLKSYAWFQNRTSAQREFDLKSQVWFKGKLDHMRGAISRWPVCPKRDSSLISLLLIRLHCLIIDIWNQERMNNKETIRKLRRCIDLFKTYHIVWITFK